MKTDVQQLIPALRFPEFEGEWERKTLGNIGEVKMCKRIFANQTTEKGEIPFYKIGTFGKTPNAYINEGLFSLYKSKFSFPKKGDILLSASGTLGRMVIYKGEDAYFQDSNIVWLENNEVLTLNNFLFYVYQIVTFESEGGTIQRLYNKIIKAAKYSNPSLPEQQKIASFLTNIDSRIQALEKKKSSLEQYKRGVMQKIFTQEIRFKDEDGKAFLEWEEKKLGDYILSYRLGGNYKNRDKITKAPLIKMGNIGRGNIVLKKIQYVNENDTIEQADILKENDLLFNTRNTLELVGKVAIWRNELNFALYNSNLMLLKFPNNVFMNYRLNSYEGVKEIKRFAIGTTSVAAVYTRDLLKLNLKIPPLAEQTHIANFLTALDKKIELVNEQIEKTKAYKKGLLQKMFV